MSFPLDRDFGILFLRADNNYVIYRFTDSKDFYDNIGLGELNGAHIINRIINPDEAIFTPLPLAVSSNLDYFALPKSIDSWRDSIASRAVNNIFYKRILKTSLDSADTIISVEDALGFTGTRVSVEDALGLKLED
jgi:hypothetical protein